MIRALPRTTNALASRRSSSSRAHSSSTKRRALSRSASSRARVSRRSASSRAHSSFMKISVAFRTARSFLTSPSRKSSSSPAAPGAARREMLSLIARWPRTSCSRSARRPARTTSEKSRRSFSQDHFGSKVSRFERSQASGDESSSLSSFSVARRGDGLDGAGGTHANERRATTRPRQIRRILFRGSRLVERCYRAHRLLQAGCASRAQSQSLVHSLAGRRPGIRPIYYASSWVTASTRPFDGQRRTEAVCTL